MSTTTIRTAPLWFCKMPTRRRAGNNTVTVALLDDKTKVRHVFGAGANFVLYKPISQQQAEASLRAAIALMKRERRRSFRVPVQLPVKLRVENGAEMEGILLDLSEDGLDVLAAQPLCPAANINARFILPDQTPRLMFAAKLPGRIPTANPESATPIFRTICARHFANGSSPMRRNFFPKIPSRFPSAGSAISAWEAATLKPNRLSRSAPALCYA